MSFYTVCNMFKEATQGVGKESHVYLVRHAESEGNVIKLWGGDLPLSGRGEEQAKSIDTSKLPDVDVIYSSPLKRALQTAQLAFPNKMVEEEPVFSEIYFGDLDQTTFTDDDLELLKRNQRLFMKEIHGDNLDKRVYELHERLTQLAELEDNTIVVMHNMIMLSWIAEMTGLGYENVGELELLDNCAIVKVTYYGGKLYSIELLDRHTGINARNLNTSLADLDDELESLRKCIDLYLRGYWNEETLRVHLRCFKDCLATWKTMSDVTWLSDIMNKFQDLCNRVNMPEYYS